MGGLQLSRSVRGTAAAVFVYNLYRAWCYSNSAVYVKVNFPIHYFGRLMGIMRIVMGLSSLVIIGLTEVPKMWPNVGFEAIFGIFIALMICGFAFPIHGFIVASRTRN